MGVKTKYKTIFNMKTISIDFDGTLNLRKIQILAALLKCEYNVILLTTRMESDDNFDLYETCEQVGIKDIYFTNDKWKYEWILDSDIKIDMHIDDCKLELNKLESLTDVKGFHIDNLKELNLLYEVECFINSYNKESDFLEQLRMFYDIRNEWIKKESVDYMLPRFKILIEHFINKESHASELKTLLILSRPFKDNVIMKETRIKLLEKYDEL